ncbi:MAG: GH92 family glycosyl hydrolase [Bacteroidales bacterium]|jgi:predicted alpha-1,2-mannosidase|nr:GH92 family glycosyl hydrolase [Bacteroidales bacterium]
MIHNRHFVFVFLLLSGAFCYGQQPAVPNYTDFVNPFIGTGGHGHTFPGACVPFGMVQLSPDTRLDGWDGCSAYHGTDSVIYGFSHTHLSGTGCSDYGDILFMPVTGKVKLTDYGYASSFTKADEKASPGYYQVDLTSFRIRAELTTTARVGFHRYTFPLTDQANIVVDLKHRDKVLESGLKVVGNDEIEGYRVSQAWAQKQMIYFVAKFSKPFKSYTLTSEGKELAGLQEMTGTDLKSYFTFSTTQNEKILVKVAISGVSIEGARRNLETEVPGWDYDSVRKEAIRKWNDELGKITIDGGTYDQQVTFYTALYHTMLQPNIYNDVDGQYRGRDLKIHQTDGFNYYTVFSLWDTYRAANPLYTLIEPKRTTDFIRTFLRQYDEGGMLPVWELSGNETGCMIGYHAVSVIADAYLKGIKDFDTLKALEAMKHSAEQSHLGLSYYQTKGYIPADKEGESVSKTLEYAYDDWCIAQMARAMGKQEDYKNFIRRAQYYKYLFDRSTGFIRAKINETWFSPFDPAEVNFNYTEANAWQYSFYVPQDIEVLMALMGGRGRFASKLDELFTTDAKTTGREQSDITGMIGQYAHGNEPSHHMAYLYDYAGQPWKTQEIVHRICKDFYKNSPDGLIGNEDCGQMSAWYIFSACGFYPVTPGSGIYAIGTPIFSNVTINLGNGKTFAVRAKYAGEQNFYIESASLNGKPYSRCYISHEDIMNGGELSFTMGPTPNRAWGVGMNAAPPSRIADYLIIPCPSVDLGQSTFIDSTMVSLSCPIESAYILYTLDGSEPSVKSAIYQQPFKFRKTTTLKAIAYKPDMPKSFTMEARFIQIPKNRKIKLNTQYAGQYSAGGDLALIDFARGGEDFRTGKWQGYEGVDLDAVVDLGSEQSVRKLSLGCYQQQNAWIFMPLEVNFSCSTDGTNFTPVATVKNDVAENEDGMKIKDFSVILKGEKVRYIKVVAKNRGGCPDGHPSAGKKAWIFVDEITIE